MTYFSRFQIKSNKKSLEWSLPSAQIQGFFTDSGMMMMMMMMMMTMTMTIILLCLVLRMWVGTVQSATRERLCWWNGGSHAGPRLSFYLWFGPAPILAVTNCALCCPWSSHNCGWKRSSKWSPQRHQKFIAFVGWFAIVGCIMWHFSGAQPKSAGSSSMICVSKRRRTGLQSWI